MKRISWYCSVIGLVALAVFQAWAPTTVRAQAKDTRQLRGGPRGTVRMKSGIIVEGVMVQLIAKTTGIRTTVFSDENGKYEFPVLPSGTYTLRIARPLEFKPWVREGVQIDGPTALAEIVLERVTTAEQLPPTPEIAAQLTGAEWLLNLEGTGEEKRLFIQSCNWCHSYQQVFRTRYDEKSWRTIVDRMTAGAGSPLIVVRPPSMLRETPEEREKIVKWLARVRGPGAVDSPFYYLPSPRGVATKVVITEYELPRLEMATHDVQGDSQGNVWYTPHRNPFVGKLDPKTGVVTEFKLMPNNPKALPGTHTVWVDKDDTVWLSENWAKTLTRLDPKTGKFTKVAIPDESGALNTPGFGNFGLSPDGYVWYNWSNSVVKVDPDTGKVIERSSKFQHLKSTYDNLVSPDGRYWVGGPTPGSYVAMYDSQTKELTEIPTRSVLTNPAKGYFDRFGNAWMGGRAGALIKLDPRTKQTNEYMPPTPFVSFYECMPDKNGEVWALELHGGRAGRFNPKTGQWIEYVLPEPYGHDRRTWVDNSTDPVTVWYADHEGYMVRIQPLE